MDPAAKSLQEALRDAIYDLKDRNRRRYQSGYDGDGRAVKEELEEVAFLVGQTGPAEGETAAAYAARLHRLLDDRRQRILAADPDDWASVALNSTLQALESDLAKRGLPVPQRR